MYLRLAGGLLALVLLQPAVSAHEVEGVMLPPRMTLAGTTLVLNGAGVRRYFVFKVYVGALYLEQRAETPRAILEGSMPKCIYLQFLRDVSRKHIARTLLDGVRANVDPAMLERLEPRIEQLRAAIPDLRAGDRVRLTFPRPARTAAWINDELVADVPGHEFQQAVLRFWLGKHPVDAHLKQALLGRFGPPQYAADLYPGTGQP